MNTELELDELKLQGFNRSWKSLNLEEADLMIEDDEDEDEDDDEEYEDEDDDFPYYDDED
jgi:hypothetical protein